MTVSVILLIGCGYKKLPGFVTTRQRVSEIVKENRIFERISF